MRRPEVARRIGWQVIARGARRLDLYRDDQDYINFLRILKYAMEVSGLTLWAYALMSNHYHLVVYATGAELTACMRRLNRMYSTYHNKRYGLTGHAFDGPYKRYSLTSLLCLLRTVAYVFLNPVVARIVSYPEQYRWSCYNDYLGLEGSPLKVNPHSLISRINSNPQIAWEQFHVAMRREANRPKRPSSDPLTRLEVHAQQFEWLLEHAFTLQLPSDIDPRLVAMYWARKLGITPKAMAIVTGARTSQSVRMLLHRFRSSHDEAELERLFPLP